MIFLGKNIKYLRKVRGVTQTSIADKLGVKTNTISNWENGVSSPGFEELEQIIKILDVDASSILYVDLEGSGILSNKKDYPIIEVNKLAKYHSTENRSIPILSNTEIAAGPAIYNGDNIDFSESIQLPPRLLKSKDAFYAAPKIKGDSMSPTLQDSGYVISRLLTNQEWQHMPNEHIYIVTDRDCKSAIKRVKNRLKQGFITLMSDNPDKASYPNYNLEVEEIVNIWHVEWYLSAKMPNIHDQYYNRLQRLEDEFEDLKRNINKGNSKA